MDDFERLFERFVETARKDYPDIDGSFTGRNAMRYDHMNGFTGPADLREALEDVLEPWLADTCGEKGECTCPSVEETGNLLDMLVEQVEGFYGKTT